MQNRLKKWFAGMVSLCLFFRTETEKENWAQIKESV